MLFPVFPPITLELSPETKAKVCSLHYFLPLSPQQNIQNAYKMHVHIICAAGQEEENKSYGMSEH